MVYRLFACAIIFALVTTAHAQNCPNGGGGPPGGGPPGMGTNPGGTAQSGFGGTTNAFQQMMMQQFMQAMMQQQMANQQRMRQPMLNAPSSRARSNSVATDEDEAQTRKRVLPTDRPLTSFERRVAALKEKEEQKRLEYEERIQQREAELALRR